jgi:hypothetical protein
VVRRDKQKGTGWRSTSSPLTCLRAPHPHPNLHATAIAMTLHHVPTLVCIHHPPNPNRPHRGFGCIPHGGIAHTCQSAPAKLGLPAAELRARTVHGVDGIRSRQASRHPRQRVSGTLGPGARRRRDQGRTSRGCRGKGGCDESTAVALGPWGIQIVKVATAVLLFCG